MASSAVALRNAGVFFLFRMLCISVAVSASQRHLDVAWDSQQGAINPLFVNTGDVIVFHYNTPLSVVRVPSWEAALSCRYNAVVDEILAGPESGSGEGFKYTVPAVGSSYFISMPTPCPVSSSFNQQHLSPAAMTSMCCQKMAVVSVEKGMDAMETILEGERRFAYFRPSFSFLYSHALAQLTRRRLTD